MVEASDGQRIDRLGGCMDGTRAAIRDHSLQSVANAFWGSKCADLAGSGIIWRSMEVRISCGNDEQDLVLPRKPIDQPRPRPCLPVEGARWVTHGKVDDLHARGDARLGRIPVSQKFADGFVDEVFREAFARNDLRGVVGS